MWLGCLCYNFWYSGLLFNIVCFSFLKETIVITLFAFVNIEKLEEANNIVLFQSTTLPSSSSIGTDF